MLTTELPRRLGIEHPIIQAGMGAEAGPDLAAAVANAGALGTIGSGLPPEKFRAARSGARDLTDRTFTINIICFLPPVDWVGVAIEERAPIVTLSFGDWQTPHPADGIIFVAVVKVCSTSRHSAELV